jgi:cobalt-zinc-cadmium resistance protein CzcA
MLDHIIRAAISGRLLVLLALGGLVLATVLAVPRLNLDAFPDVTNVQVVVNTEARGLANS